ncbi:MAG: hypothetical protein JKY03_00385 [Aureispira sp.]|nr:hypothetical protein [Aureispira sp.]
MKQLLFFTFGLIFLFSFSSCLKIDTTQTNHTTIDIISSGSNIADLSQSRFQVELTATENLHKVEITLTDNDGEGVAPFNPMILHDQGTSLTIDETINLISYSRGDYFTFSINVCENESCLINNRKSSIFDL